MRYVTGAICVLIGALFAAGSAGMGAAVTRSNRASTGRFKYSGWQTWNRFIFILVGACLAGYGLALIVGLVD